MEIQEETPIYKEGESQYSLLRYAAMAAKWKEPPRDALDTLTLGAVSLNMMCRNCTIFHLAVSVFFILGGHGILG